MTLEGDSIGASFAGGKLHIPAGLQTWKYYITLKAQNDHGSASMKIEVYVSGTKPINGQSAGTDAISLTEGYEAFTKKYAVTGDPAPTLALTDTLGIGATLNADGTLTIPAGLTKGEYALQIKAQNKEGSATMDITVSVTAPPPPVIIITPPSISGAEVIELDEEYAQTRVQYRVTGYPAPTVSLTDTQSTGAILGVDGTLTIPAGLTKGEYPLQIIAQSTAGTATKDITVRVTGTAPQISGGESSEADTIILTQGYGAYTKQYSVTGAPPPTFSVVGDNVTIDEDGLLSIAPGLAVGTHNATVTAENSNGTATLVLTIIVEDPYRVVITTTSLREWTQNHPGYSAQINATGGYGDLSFAHTGGTLPTGLSLSANGLLSGAMSASIALAKAG